jgi:hypothetical protein
MTIFSLSMSMPNVEYLAYMCLPWRCVWLRPHHAKA